MPVEYKRKESEKMDMFEEQWSFLDEYLGDMSIISHGYTNYRLDDIKRNLSYTKFNPLNIIITGNTGAGKSSTINALFFDNVAKVGTGVEPETMDLTSYSLNNYMRFWDTPGLGDGIERDKIHSKKLIDLMYKTYEVDNHTYGYIDMILVIVEGINRDMGTTYQLLNDIIIPNFQSDRILIAINQADVAMKNRYWNKKDNCPDKELINFLEEQATSIQRRIKEATNISIKRPVYYSAEFNYNINVLYDFIIDNIPHERRKLVKKEASNTNLTGRESLIDLSEKLKKKLYSVQIPKVEKADVLFNANDYIIDNKWPGGNFDYKSEGVAIQKGLQDFNRVCYSKGRTFVINMFSEYKHKKLKPFYTMEANDNSFYYKVNKQVEQILKEFASAAKAISNGKCILTEKFCQFEVYPGQSGLIKDSIDNTLRNFETRIPISSLIKDFEINEGHFLHTYRDYIDTYMVESEEEGLFGLTKHKREYCYDAHIAVIQYKKDLTDFLNRYDITRISYFDVSAALDDYKKEFHKALEEKIDEFSNALKS